jgi:DNA-binding NarL/FixJ family response regulator
VLSLVVVAGDLEVVRSCRVALRYAACFRVVATLDGTAPIRRDVERLAPDVVLVHDLPPRVKFLRRIREAHEAAPHGTVLALARCFEASILEDARQAGATSVVPAELSPGVLGAMLRELAFAHARTGAVVHHDKLARTSV